MKRIVQAMIAAVVLPALMLPIALPLLHMAWQDYALTGRLAVLLLPEIWLWLVVGAIFGLSYDRLPGRDARTKAAVVGAVLGLLVAAFYVPVLLDVVRDTVPDLPMTAAWLVSIVGLPFLYAGLWAIVGAIFDTFAVRST